MSERSMGTKYNSEGAGIRHDESIGVGPRKMQSGRENPLQLWPEFREGDGCVNDECRKKGGVFERLPAPNVADVKCSRCGCVWPRKR